MRSQGTARIAGTGATARQLPLPFTAAPDPVRPVLGRLEELLARTVAEHQPGMTPPSVRVSTRMTRTLGSYSPERRSIALSARLIAFGDMEQRRSILLHEAAHAIVHHRDPPAPAHGALFKSVCDDLGIEPARFVNLPLQAWRDRQRFAYRCDACRGLVLRKRAVRRVRCACGAALTPRRAARVALSASGQHTLIGYVELHRPRAGRRHRRRR